MCNVLLWSCNVRLVRMTVLLKYLMCFILVMDDRRLSSYLFRSFAPCSVHYHYKKPLLQSASLNTNVLHQIHIMQWLSSLYSLLRAVPLLFVTLLHHSCCLSTAIKRIFKFYFHSINFNWLYFIDSYSKMNIW